MLFDTATDHYRTLATFDSVLQAHVAAGRLQAEGLDAVIADANHAAADWLVMQALGGVKIRIPAEQYDAARAVLARVEAGDFALQPADTDGAAPKADDAAFAPEGPVAPAPLKDPSCPVCHGPGQPWHSWRWRLSMLLVHTLALPLPVKDRDSWRCTECDKRWRSDSRG